jgi:hypothetical protein
MLPRLSSRRLNILFALTLLLGFAAFQFPWAGLQEGFIAAQLSVRQRRFCYFVG